MDFRRWQRKLYLVDGNGNRCCTGVTVLLPEPVQYHRSDVGREQAGTFHGIAYHHKIRLPAGHGALLFRHTNKKIQRMGTARQLQRS